MSGKSLKIIMSGDSAGATLAVNVVVKILEINNASQRSSHATNLPLPISLVLSYAALDFNLTSWMTPEGLRVLRTEQSSGNLPGLKELAAQKDHLQHVSPLSMVVEKRTPKRKRLSRHDSWKDTIRSLTGGLERDFDTPSTPILKSRHSTSALPGHMFNIAVESNVGDSRVSCGGEEFRGIGSRLIALVRKKEGSE